MKTETHEDFTLFYDDSPEAKERVFQIALKWFKKLDHFNGESLQQCDNTHVEAPQMLTELAEEGFCFVKDWNE